MGWLGRLFVRDKITSSDTEKLIHDSLSEKENTHEMLVNLRNLQTLRLDDISVPKADIIALSDDVSFDDVIEIFRTSTFTRVPVYSETLDNPVGLIHLKDFALSHGFGSSNVFTVYTSPNYSTNIELLSLLVVLSEFSLAGLI